MSTTIRFHKALHKFTNGNATFTVDGTHSYFELIRMSMSMFPKLENVFKKYLDGKNKHEELAIIVDREVLPLENIFFNANSNSEIILCPVIYGAGKIFRVIFAIALFAIIIFVPGLSTVVVPMEAGAAAASGALHLTIGQALSAGYLTSASSISLSYMGHALSSIATSLLRSALAPTPKMPSEKATAANNAFTGLAITTSTNTPVSLTYGLDRVTGHYISLYAKVVDHQETDIVRVGDYV